MAHVRPPLVLSVSRSASILLVSASDRRTHNQVATAATGTVPQGEALLPETHAEVLLEDALLGGDRARLLAVGARVAFEKA
jgi:hypothetical protein